MPDEFTYDVFLSHTAQDKGVVRDIAQRLKKDGIKVWFDEWEILPGDSILAKIEEGLEQSRILVLCLSAHSSGSDWASLESNTFRFRDPQNKDRRFIPLRLDDAPVKGPLAHFLAISWVAAARESAYPKVLESCRPPQIQPAVPPEQQTERERLIEMIHLLGHTAGVLSVAWSPDGKRALSGAYDKTIRLWEVDSGRCLCVLEGHTDSVTSVAWSPDGKCALSGAHDNTLRLWEVDSGRCLRVLEGHTDSVMSVAWSPDGKRALSGAHDKTMRSWQVDSGSCLHLLQGHINSVLSVAWSPDGKCAISGALDNTVRLWEVDSGRCLRVLEGHTSYVSSVEWSPDGSHALSGAYDNTVRLWEVNSGRCIRVLQSHTSSVSSVAWSPDGKRVLSGALDNTVRLWEVDSGRCIYVLEGHTKPVLSVAWSPDGSRALSGADDDSVRLWEMDSGRCLRVLEGHTSNINSVAKSPNGKRALSGANDKTLRLWEIGSGRCIRVLEGHTSSVTSVAWSSDGKLALSGSDDDTLRLWEPDSGRCICVLEGHTSYVRSVAWSPDGKRALSGADDKTLRLWEVDSGRCMRVLEGHTSHVNSVVWSPDGKLALSGAGDNTLRLWEVDSGRCIRVLEGHTSHVNSLAWGPDGRRVLSAAHDKTMRLWEIYSGRCIRVLEGHTHSVTSVSWSPDSRRALSGAADKTVRVWEVETGRCIRSLEGHTGEIRSVEWQNNGERAFSAAKNGICRTWNLVESADPKAVSEHGQNELPETEQAVQYTNAKVLLVGDSGAGKTGLSKRLAINGWEPSDSTVGAWATQWKLEAALPTGQVCDGVEREIWLWDFGGQSDQRLIHQLYMDETALVVLVFDGQKEDVLEALDQWDRDLSRACTRTNFTKLLVAGRVDAGGLRMSRSHVDTFKDQRGYRAFLQTSAKTNAGCAELKDAILEGIQWENIPWRSSPLLFKRLKEEIIKLKDEDRVLMRFNELRNSLRLRLAGAEAVFKDEELKAVISLLAGPGVVWELKFGGWVLLQPERINAYAQAVIQTMQADEHERGCLAEEQVLKGELKYQASKQRLEDGDEERFVLLAMHQTLVERGLCLRQHTPMGNMLIFPRLFEAFNGRGKV